MLELCLLGIVFCSAVLGILFKIFIDAFKEYLAEKKYEKEMSIYRRMKAIEDLKVWGR